MQLIILTQSLPPLTSADDVSYDNFMDRWNATIIGPQNTPLGTRTFFLVVRCGPRYPEEPPQIRFVSKINMDGVDQNGYCRPERLYSQWNRESTMYDYLCAIRQAMVGAARVKQPREDETYN